MIYVYVDTNILVRVLTQGRPGCEFVHFRDLAVMAREGVIRLLVPEVLLLEFDKQLRALPIQIGSSCDKLANLVGKASEGLWNEMNALGLSLLQTISQYKRTKLKQSKKYSAKLLRFLQSSAVHRIALTNEIWLNAQKRMISGRMASMKNSCSQDAMIVESLASFFRDSQASDDTLLFCSENWGDFAVETPTKGDDRSFALHPAIQNDLPPSQYCTNLQDMLRFAAGYESLPTPDDEQIRLAATMRDLCDEEDELWLAANRVLEEQLNRKIAEQFEREVAPTLPTHISNVRRELVDKISVLLRDCRTCAGWSDHSELKLCQWLENVPEDMIPCTSLPGLVRIKINLTELLRRHHGNGQAASGNS